MPRRRRQETREAACHRPLQSRLLPRTSEVVSRASCLLLKASWASAWSQVIMGCSMSADSHPLLRGGHRAPSPLTQAHGLEIQPDPLTSPSVDRVDTRQSSIVQLEHTVDLTLMLDDLGDGPRPAAQGHIGEVGVAYARLDPNLVPDLEARDDRSLFLVGHGSLLGGIVCYFAGDVGDQTLLEGNFLYLSCASSDVHDEAIDFLHPDHRAVVHATWQRPMMIELPNLEHGADGFRFALAGAFADSERLVDGGQLHVRFVTAVVKKVDPTNRANDPTRPGLRLAAEQGGRAFACQLLSQTATQNGILFVEPLPAELVDHCDNQLKNRGDFPRKLACCFALCHVFPVLVLVRESMSMVGVFYVSGTDQLTEGESLGRNGATLFPVQRRPLPLVSPPACSTSPESLAGTESPSPVHPSSPFHTAASPTWHRPQEGQR